MLSERLKQVENEVLAEHYKIKNHSRRHIRFIDFCKIYIDQKQYKKTIDRDQQRLAIIAEIIGDPYLHSLNKQVIQKIETKLHERKLSVVTINRYFELLRNLFNLAMQDSYISFNPVSKYYIPYAEEEKRRALTPDEIKRILKACEYIQRHPRSEFQKIFYDFSIFALNVPLRLSEIINLKKSYIHGDVLKIPYSTTKSKKRETRKAKYKTVFLNTIANDIITKYSNSDKEYVFPLSRRDPNIVYYSVKRVRKLSGIKEFSFHYFRHTISTLIASELSLSTAMAVLGHTNLSTTLRYTHPTDDLQKSGSILANFTESIISK